MSQHEDLELPPQSITAKGTNILDLHFYSLDAIFSVECLSIMDLCSIGESHTSFKEVVDGVFAKRHRKCIVRFSTPNVLENTRRTLRNFGSLISELSINAHDISNEILAERTLLDVVEMLFNWLIEYCSDTLESLKLTGMVITKDQTIKLKPLVDKLHTITLKSCNVCSGEMLFSSCRSLVEFKLMNVVFEDQLNALRTNTFPKLQQCCIYRSTMESNDQMICSEFFSRHRKVKALSLNCMDLLPMVTGYYERLTELNFKIEKNEHKAKFSKALRRILRLHYLSKLNIKCGRRRNLTKFIQQLSDVKSLEFLSLWHVRVDAELVPALSKLTTLQSLKLHHCDGLANLHLLADLDRLTELKIDSKVNEQFDFSLEVLPMIKRVIGLKTLHLAVRSFQMDKRIYLQILEALRGRPDKFQDVLRISCCTTEDFVTDSQFNNLLKIKRIFVPLD